MFFDNYFTSLQGSISSIESNELSNIADLFLQTSINGKKIIFVGNGGSASIASHLTIDCINAISLRAVNFNESSIITCLANDFGYENWITKAIDFYGDKGDLIVLISSSGQSANMINGAKKALLKGLRVVTLTGFLKDNPLSKLGEINLWVNSIEYNKVEMTHHIWLLSIVDFIAESAKKESES